MNQRSGMCAGAIVSRTSGTITTAPNNKLATGAGQELCLRVKQEVVVGIRIPRLGPRSFVAVTLTEANQRRDAVVSSDKKILDY